MDIYKYILILNTLLFKQYNPEHPRAALENSKVGDLQVLTPSQYAGKQTFVTPNGACWIGA